MAQYVDFRKIEEKWQKRWEEEKVFEADPSKKEKFFLTIPYPYPSGDLHIGHARTFTRGDIIARLKRMQGYNTLFPQGFHLSGNRLQVLAKNIKRRDSKTIETLKSLYGIKEEDFHRFEKPEEAGRYFSEQCINTLKRGGFSIDWRRTFGTLDDNYKKFITWQFNRLKNKGYVQKGSHPVIYCPGCESPITQSDRAEGEEAIVQGIDIWKYPMENGAILPAATLRPETIFAITNIYINPGADYVVVKVGKEKWVLSKSAAENLEKQRKDVSIEEKIPVSDLIGKKFSNPVTGRKNLVVLPGEFVNPDHATGIVASEPSDAPDDHVALEELKENEGYLDKYNLKKEDVESIEYISLITTPGYGKHPAVEICQKMGIKKLKDPKLSQAKKEIYKLQYHKGKLNENAGDLEGMSVPEAIESVKKKHKDKMSVMYAPSEKVVCKCGTDCHIKLLENQWFLTYGDEKWKSRVRSYMKEMDIYPEFWRPAFNAALEWTQDKACARKSGLGTPLPWDNEWIVETLSDSTIYMLYYIIAKFLKEQEIKTEQLGDEFFNYVILGEGKAEKVSKNLKMDQKILEKIRHDVEYWYPVDWRNSAKDLVSNHLLYYVYNHVALFPRKYWPKAISVNGFVNLEGEKMSKSKGRAVTFSTAIDRYGADAVRIVNTTCTMPEQDSDFRYEEAEAMVKWINRFYETVSKISLIKQKDLSKEGNIDKWFTSRINSSIKETTDNLEGLKTRAAAQVCIYKMSNDLKWYLRRTGGGVSKSAITCIENWIKILSVYMPHITEELWEKLGNKPFVSTSKWPEFDEKKTNAEAEMGEELVKTIINDVEEIKKITGINSPKKISIFVAPKWKYDVYKDVKEGRQTGDFMKKEGYRKIGKDLAVYVQNLMKKRFEKNILEKTREIEVLKSERVFLEKLTEAKINIIEVSNEKKAKQAEPMKPGIFME